MTWEAGRSLLGADEPNESAKESLEPSSEESKIQGLLGPRASVTINHMTLWGPAACMC